MAAEETDALSSPRGDFFHQGVITKLFPSNNTGVVRTESGRELTFSYELVVLVGEAKSPLDLKVGEPVGYDLGWTSNGLRITKLKTYPKTGAEIDPPGSEGQRNQSEDLPPQNLPDKDSQ
ncbi:MAG TPA: hypothetical protein VEQ38_18005 [Verrucomicrobiae bacterium]|nr:hypothetical protein [Verrucomicrobiae bacterium]